VHSTPGCRESGSHEHALPRRPQEALREFVGVAQGGPAGYPGGHRPGASRPSSWRGSTKRETRIWWHAANEVRVPRGRGLDARRTPWRTWPTCTGPTPGADRARDAQPHAEEPTSAALADPEPSRPGSSSSPGGGALADAAIVIAPPRQAERRTGHRRRVDPYVDPCRLVVIPSLPPATRETSDERDSRGWAV